jgi:hypothetical protein
LSDLKNRQRDRPSQAAPYHLFLGESCSTLTYPISITVQKKLETQELKTHIGLFYHLLSMGKHVEIWIQRWLQLYNEIHGAAFCLDTEYHFMDHSSDQEVMFSLMSFVPICRREGAWQCE